SPGFFSPFPHNTNSLSVDKKYLNLRHNRRRFRQDCTCPALLKISTRPAEDFTYGAFTLYGPPFQAARLSSLVLNAAPLPRQSCLWRFGLFRFHSPLLTKSLLFSFPPNTKIFHFPGFTQSELLIHPAIRQHYPPWVSPFEYRQINT